MKILVLNSGSSSIKFQLFLMDENKSIASGLIEQIGQDNSHAILKANGEVYERFVPIKDHNIGLEIMNELFRESGTLHDLKDLDGIGHRIVHGGETFKSSALVNDDVIKKIENNIALAPLHNPGHLAGIKTAMKSSGDVPHVVVFDTVFHQTMPEYAYRYAIPYEISKKNHVRRYGFHGTSHNYVSQEAAKFLNIPYEKLNAITLHLGNGASVCAIKNGKSVDTSMGLSPLEGLIMGTRSGDIDPAVLTYLISCGGLKAEDMDDFLNKKSGLFGICGTNDMRNIEEKIAQNDELAKLAFEMFCYRIKKYIGAYYAVVGKLDAIIFTGGIGENDQGMREKVCNGLKHFGISIDNSLNKDRSNRGNRCLDDNNATIKTLVIPTNEELMIATETLKFIKK
ncbi:acetate kinase [Campylobacter pinnipediorum subsp. caledonicus]|uniref:acetate kinase n=1 Tax=Campylobacter pinnipediorum TaxID=1965231 RepID=UPI000995BB05|nr:acetate kinase [Campylobacter pinnipediorum]AQW86048.1 acetate kinase [Campylobacter pinnipediorum subsp. caledonicus]